MTTKRCSRCGDEKSVVRFPVRPSRVAHKKGTLYAHCLDCKREAGQRYYQANRAAVIRRTSARLVGVYHRDIERSRANGRRTYRVDIEQSRARNRHKRNANIVRVRARQAAWRRRFRQAHPELARAIDKRYSAEKNAKRRGATVTGPVDYERICARDRMRCHISHKQVKPTDLHLDHVIPLAKGGTHSETNIAVSHAWCNLRKAAKVLTLF